MRFSYLALVVALVISAIVAGCVTAPPAGQSTLIIAVKDAPKISGSGTIPILT